MSLLRLFRKCCLYEEDDSFLKLSDLIVFLIVHLFNKKKIIIWLIHDIVCSISHDAYR